jgi:hypothetical protein
MAEKFVPLYWYEKVRALEDKFHNERDRRYTEVSAERAKALQIKEAGDAKALELAREIQDYKDEKANQLRTQIEAERGSYATKDEIKPLTAFVLTQQGGGKVWIWVSGAAFAGATLALSAAAVFMNNGAG